MVRDKKNMGLLLVRQMGKLELFLWCRYSKRRSHGMN